MTVRKRSLPEGWYPHDESSAARDLDACLAAAERLGAVSSSRSDAVVAPHASWFYSGALASAAVSSLRRDCETVIVFGGHLSETAQPLIAVEDAFATPFGLLSADTKLRDVIKDRFPFSIDRMTDNTVEIILPILKRLYPAAMVLWLRMPASMESFQIGKAIGAIASETALKIAAVGSTDLTHYGPNYGFMPKGVGPEALRWVRETNDRRFIDAMLSGDAQKALSLAVNEGSACSPGGAIAALGFAQARGADFPRLLGYATSADVSPAASFVGYAALSWEQR